MVDLIALKAANGKRWAAAKLVRKTSSDNIAGYLFRAKPRYQAVERATGVPWFIVAVIHEREASQNWHTQLGQGDPLDAVSVHVPAGRGPFKTWEDGAIDALKNCAPFLSRRKDWSLGESLVALETYNGTGYAAKGLPSPYLWAGTDQYTSGKYVRDGKFDPSAVDSQLGCAALLKSLMALDPTITFTGLVLTPITAGDTKPKPTDLHEKDNAPNVGPEGPSPSLAFALSKLIAFILSLFKKGK